MLPMIYRRLAITALWSLILPAYSEVKIKVAHNSGEQATKDFKFKDVPSPVKDDLGSKAKLSLVDGETDESSADLTALNDGAFPTDEDQPDANFFFDAGTPGGRFR